jgi:hypothetical protein
MKKYMQVASAGVATTLEEGDPVNALISLFALKAPPHEFLAKQVVHLPQRLEYAII